MNRKTIALAALIIVAALPIAAYASSQLPAILTNPLAPFQNWAVVIGAGILLSFSVAGLLYMFGKMINDNNISARGINEAGQSVGTAIFAVAILSMMIFFGNFIYHSNLITGTIGKDVGSMCAGFAYSQLDSISGNPTSNICALAASARTGSASSAINYPLEATYIITANLTNQAANNMNGFYQLEGLVAFLRNLKAVDTMCEVGPACTNPLIKPIIKLTVSSTPFAGDKVIHYIGVPLQKQAIIILYLFLIQQLLLLMLLNVWPYMLAAGILLRAIPLTRGAGGLLMGISLAAVIVLPMVMLIEYSMLNSAIPAGALAGASPSDIVGLTMNGLPVGQLNVPGSQYYNQPVSKGGTVITYNALTQNFYVFPNSTNVANYNNCYPIDGSMPAEIAKDSIAMAGLGIVYSTGLGGFVPSTPTAPIGILCSPNDMIAAILAETQVYGMMSVAGFILPLLNILLVISAVKNISFLFGGDTDIAGIGRLV